MNSVLVALFVFGSAFCCGLVGMVLHVRLPEHHLDAESRDVVKLVMGLVATISALVLGLLISSANTSHEQQSSELKGLSANIILLDRTLEAFGPGGKALREQFSDDVRRTHDRIWSREGIQPENLDSKDMRNATRAFAAMVRDLPSETATERALQSTIMQQTESIEQTRLLMFEQLGAGISWPFLAVLVFWIGVLFLGFGLLARFHATVTVTLLVGAISVAGALFLILELSQPFQGIMRVSDEPLLKAMALIDQ